MSRVYLNAISTSVSGSSVHGDWGLERPKLLDDIIIKVCHLLTNPHIQLVEQFLQSHEIVVLETDHQDRSIDRYTTQCSAH